MRTHIFVPTLLTLLFTFPLHLTAAAQRDHGFCQTFDNLRAQAANAFANLRGRPLRGGAWQSTLTLPRAFGCWIDEDDDFWCEWRTDSPNKGMAEYTTFAEGLTTCYSERAIELQRGKEMTVVVVGGGASAAVEFYVDFSRRDLRVNLSISRVSGL